MLWLNAKRLPVYGPGWVFFVLALLVLGWSNKVQANETLRLCTEAADVRPWRMMDGKGLNFELINAAARRIGATVTYVPLPWKRCLAELKANTVDGAFAASFNVDRLGIGRYPGGATPNPGKRLHMDTYVVMRRKGDVVNWDGKVFSALQSPVGIQLGYSVRERLEELKIPYDDGSTSARELLMKLAIGRVNAAAVLSSEILYLLNSEPELAGKLEILPKVLVEKPYYVMLSNQFATTKPAVAEAFWNAIEAARNSPSYRKLEDQAKQGRAF